MNVIRHRPRENHLGLSFLLVCLILVACSESSGVTPPPDTEPPEETPSDSLPTTPVPDLFVSSRNTDSVKRFNGKTGAFLGDFVASGSGGLTATQEVAFGPDGHLYVSGRGNRHILKFDGQTGAFLERFTSGYDLDNPTKMTFGPDGMLYVSQWGTQQNTVARFDAATGAFVDERTPPLGQPMNHAWDADGHLYVAVFDAGTVRRFDEEGHGLGTFTQSSTLRGPVNLWFGEDGDLFVVEWETGSIKRFDGQTGAFQSDFITNLTRAEGVTIDADGVLYVCDWQRNQINYYNAETGQPLGVFTREGNMQQPNSLTFAPSQASE